MNYRTMQSRVLLEIVKQTAGCRQHFRRKRYLCVCYQAGAQCEKENESDHSTYLNSCQNFTTRREHVCEMCIRIHSLVGYTALKSGGSVRMQTRPR